MRIHSISLVNFRNFDSETIVLPEKALIFGSNDIGKSNLLYGIRLLLDRDFSERDLELSESDFCVHTNEEECEITLQLKDVDEDILITKLREHISDDGSVWLRYTAVKSTRQYTLYIGSSSETLEEIPTRYYIRFLNMRHIASKRDLFNFIRTERKNLLHDAREDRTEEEKDDDQELLEKIEVGLAELESQVRRLSYINKSTNTLNSELRKLSSHHQDHEIVFDTGSTSATQFVDNLKLASKVNDKSVQVGGDGRNSQIHLALWSMRYMNRDADATEVTLFCIEEPEIHLHPHQQRRIAKYLADLPNTQVLITTHSAQIAEAFSPKSLVRLYRDNTGTRAASSTSNLGIDDAFLNFGYRHNLLSAEAFFASKVFLVEGPSEVIFYRTICNVIAGLITELPDDYEPDPRFDLDRYNISVLSVDGIGFEPYIRLLQALRIPCALRTDNDIFKEQGKTTFRLAGIARIVSILANFFPEVSLPKLVTSGLDEQEAKAQQSNLYSNLKSLINEQGLFLSEIDLEHDMYDALSERLDSHFFTTGLDTIQAMQKQKAINIFEFLHGQVRYLTSNDIQSLKSHSLLAAIRYLVEE